jgi:hypothetical protein
MQGAKNMSFKPLLKKISRVSIYSIIAIISFAITCFLTAFFVLHVVYIDQLRALYSDPVVLFLLTLAVWIYTITTAVFPFAIAMLLSVLYKIRDYQLFMIFGFVTGMLGTLVFTTILQQFFLWRCALLVLIGIGSGALYYFLYSRLMRVFVTKAVTSQ